VLALVKTLSFKSVRNRMAVRRRDAYLDPLAVLSPADPPIEVSRRLERGYSTPTQRAD
jgi:hypothetical protein